MGDCRHREIVPSLDVRWWESPRCAGGVTFKYPQHHTNMVNGEKSQAPWELEQQYQQTPAAWEKTVKICPRPGCGAPITWIEKRVRGEHVYYYAVHETRFGKQRKIKKCYLGAERYQYVEMFNPIGLAGLVDGSRFARYIDNIINAADAMLPESIEKLRELLETLNALETTIAKLKHRVIARLTELDAQLRARYEKYAAEVYEFIKSRYATDVSELREKFGLSPAELDLVIDMLIRDKKAYFASRTTLRAI